MTEKIRVAWSHNDDTTVRYVYINKDAYESCHDDAELTELVNQAIWEMVSCTGWTVHDAKPAEDKLLYVKVTWEVDDGCAQQVTYIEQEAYNACKSEADKEDLVCERVGESFRGLGWVVTEVEENVDQHAGATSDTPTPE